jgi:hypothetical protein
LMEDGLKILPLPFLKTRKGRNAPWTRPWRKIDGSHKSACKMASLLSTSHNLSPFGKCFNQSMWSQIPQTPCCGSPPTLDAICPSRHTPCDFWVTQIPQCLL